MNHHEPSSLERFRTAFDALPLIAILRGITPPEARTIGQALYDAGLRLIEVPLNSPRAVDSIRLLAAQMPDCLIGAGTVLEAREVWSVHEARGRLIVAPNFDDTVVAEARAAAMAVIPGVATPSEAFGALKLGATALKLFPAEAIPPAVLRAWRAVIPPEVALLPVGGIVPEKIAGYRAAGATGFGLGSALYRPGDDARAVAERARRFVAAWDAANGRFTA